MRDRPEKEELQRRIELQLSHRAGSESVKLLWKGYIAALLEWGMLKVKDHDELSELLGVVGDDELKEIFLGIPGQYE
jgi:hypothetical protein